MVDLEHKLATTLIAAMFTQLLYGVALSQAIYYFWVYREDSPRFKYLVAWWLLLDTVKTGATLQAVCAEIVSTHGSINAVEMAPVSPTDGVQNSVGWVLVFSVHCFYIYNMNQVLSQSKHRIIIICVAIMLSIMTLVAGSVAICLDMYKKGTLPHVDMGAIAPPCMVLITDIYIAFFLWRGLRATRPPIRGRTDRIISRLITYNSERGILLCIVQLICLAAYIYDLVSNITGTTGSIYFIEGPIYFNSGMAVLNVRRHMRERLANHHLFVETMHLERRSRLEGDNGIAR